MITFFGCEIAVRRNAELGRLRGMLALEAIMRE